LIGMSPTDEELYMRRADLYMKIRQFKKAIDSYTQAMKLDPDKDVERYYKARAIAYTKLGQPAQAAADSTRAAELSASTRRPQHKKLIARSFFDLP
jgi:tetratricopeptide (TPR) repeat protein